MRDLFALARSDRRAAENVIGALSVEDQVALICQTPVARRAELLELVPDPERVVPALPEAELVFTVKGIGRADTAWLLAHARMRVFLASSQRSVLKTLKPSRSGK